MKRGWVFVLLLLSIGVNLGLIGTAIARRQRFERFREERGRIEPSSGRWSDRFDRGDRDSYRRWRDDPGYAKEIGEKVADRLELAGEPRERFLAAQKRMSESVRLGRREISRVREDMRRELSARAPDRARIDSLLAELDAAEGKLNRAFVEGILDVRSQLEGEKSREYLRLLVELGVARPDRHDGPDSDRAPRAEEPRVEPGAGEASKP